MIIAIASVIIAITGIVVSIQSIRINKKIINNIRRKNAKNT